MEGMSLALEWSQQDVLAETDFMEVGKMINNPSRDSSQLGHLVEHVKHLMNQGRSFIVNKISREMNQVRYLLAHFGRLEERTLVWLGSGPDEILDLILRNCNVTII